MKKYQIHVCFVFEKFLSNVLAALDDEIKPEKVVLCTPNRFINELDSAVSFFERKGLGVEVVELGDPYDLKSLKQKFLNLAAEFDKPENVAVNLSGGNKIMTIAAQAVFMENGFDCFYVVGEKDQIIMVKDNDREPFDIQDKLKIEDFCEIRGSKLRKVPKRHLLVPAESRALFKEIFGNIDDYLKPLSSLNYFASAAERDHTLSILHNIPENQWQILQLFYDHGAIKYYDNHRITFSSEKGREFCQGFWLEDHIYLELKKVDNEIGLQDFACSVEIENDHGVPNELDAVFLYNNHLYLVECKTAKMKEKGTDVIYKIDTLNKSAWLPTKSIIASFRKLKKHDLKRAEDLGISVISGSALLNFSKFILKLLQPEITETHR